MNENYTKEIDLIDLFIDWLSHWKSLIAVIVVGVILAGGYIFMRRNASVEIETEIKNENEITDDFLNNLAEGTLLSTLKKEQLEVITVQDMEKYFLSEKDIMTVDEVIALNEEYNENLTEYDANKSELELADRAEAFNFIANSKNIIEARKAALSADQAIYYYAKLGINIVAGKDNSAVVGDEKNSVEDTIVANKSSEKKAILIIVLIFILHFIAVACRYIFSNRVKHSDKLSSMVGVPEYTRMIDWTKIDSAKGLNKLVNKIRFGKIRRTPLKEIVEINTSATIEKLNNKNYISVAVVGVGLDDERNMLVRQIKNDNENIVVKSIDSITHSVNGSDDIVGVDSAILTVRVGVSRYNDFIEELQSLRDRDVDVIGIAVFE